MVERYMGDFMGKKKLRKSKKLIVFSVFCLLAVSALISLIAIRKFNPVFYYQVVRGRGNIIANYKKYNEEQKLLNYYYSNTLKKNSKNPLNISTYDGSNQATHPDIVHDPDGIFHYKYWMAFTPYPYYNDELENPCILASEDGINFVKPKGEKNPLDNVNQKMNPGGHLSDTDLMFVNNQLVLHYVYNTESVGKPTKFYEIKSGDGINWSRPKVVYKTGKNHRGFSPAFVPEKNNIIKMWFYQGEDNLVFTESTDGEKTWKPLMKCRINMGIWKGWHVDIIKTDTGYEGLICARQPRLDQYALFYARSKDGLNWNTSEYPLISPKKDSWDSKLIYRSTFLKENGIYRIWYSACSQANQWHIAYTQFTAAEIQNLKML